MKNNSETRKNNEKKNQKQKQKQKKTQKGPPSPINILPKPKKAKERCRFFSG
jgi:hypothetical protein